MLTIHIQLQMKISYLKRFLKKISGLVSTYLSFILIMIFLVPWINGKLAVNDSSEVITIVEVFVLSSATLSLLTFTYIVAMTDLHEKVKKSMVVSGESFFIATVQFIVGLGIFLLVRLTISHFINISTVTLTFSMDSVVSILLFLAQLIGVYEITSALSKFSKGIIEIYKSFRIKKVKIPRIYDFLQK